MNVSIIVPPPFEPVTLAEVYSHLRLDPQTDGSPPETTHPDDAMLAMQIQMAREYAEASQRRSFVQRTLRLSVPFHPWHLWTNYGYGGYGYNGYDNYPFVYLGQSCDRYIELPRGPVSAVLAVKYYDSDGAQQIIDSTNYALVPGQVARLGFVQGYVPPVTWNVMDAMQVDYVAGYLPNGSPPVDQSDYAANVPAQVKGAILLGVQLQYDNLPPPDRDRMEHTRDALLSSEHVFRIP